jgi:3-oxoacyl-[acyl-carrier protein] reductase
MDMLLKNKNAVIYGAGGAIGGAVARAFAREGAKVFLAGRTLAKLDKVAKEISAAGGTAETAQVDAVDERSITKHADAVVAKAGSIDISFNAIAVDGNIQGTPLLEQSPADVSLPVKDRVATNFLTARAAARHMLPKGTGVILMINATPARMAIPLPGSFGVECAAVEGLCRSLASEFGPGGVRVVCLRSAGSPDSPGVEEAMALHGKGTGTSREAFEASMAQSTLLRQLPKLEEVGNVAALMASDYAGPMTGTVANMSCGQIVD